ncbi:MAG: helix-turn-helix transcriptional regulator [Bacteroidota bacterium]
MIIHFTQNIKHLRKLRGMTMKEVAKALGVDYSSVVKYEHGKSYPKVENLLLLGEILDVNLHDLFYHDFTTGPPPTATPNTSEDQSTLIRVIADLQREIDELRTDIIERDDPEDIALIKAERDRFIKDNPELAQQLGISSDQEPT